MMTIGLVMVAVGLGGVGLLVVIGWRRRQAVRAAAGQALLGATEAGDLARMRALLARGADLKARNAYGWTPLHIAVMGGDEAVVTLLLQHGANVHAQSNIGETPLQMATLRGGKKALIEVLLAHGARADTSLETDF